MKLEINGKPVEVDDSFAKLSPEDQQKTVNEIAASMTPKETITAQEPGMIQNAVNNAGEAVGLNPNQTASLETYAAQAAARPMIGGPISPSAGLQAAQQQLFPDMARPGTGFQPGPVLKPGFAAANEVGQLGKIAGKVTPNIVSEVLQTPLQSTRDFVQAFTERYAGDSLNKSIGQGLSSAKSAMTNPQTYMNVAKGAGRMAVAGLTAPENLMLLPYTMSADERAKIAANPNAPEYRSNPLAMATRGQYQNPGVAGAANQQAAVANQRYGGLSAQEQSILQKDRMAQEMRRRAAGRVLPIAPGPM